MMGCGEVELMQQKKAKLNTALVWLFRMTINALHHAVQVQLIASESCLSIRQSQ